MEVQEINIIGTSAFLHNSNDDNVTCSSSRILYPWIKQLHFFFNMQLQNKKDARSAKKQTAAFSFQAFSGKAQAVQYGFILRSLCHTSSISKYFTDMNNISKQTGCALRETVM